MIRFDISVSPNYKGFSEYTYFSLENKSELVQILERNWYKAGLTFGAGEANLYASFKCAGQFIKLPLGTFKFFSNGEFRIMLDIDFIEGLAEKLQSIGYIVDESLAEEEHFPFLIDHIFDIAE